MLISHKKNDLQLEQITERLLQQFEDLGKEELNDKISLAHQLNDFELGRFLLSNKGLNGYWTSYAISKAPEKNDLSELELFHTIAHLPEGQADFAGGFLLYPVIARQGL